MPKKRLQRITEVSPMKGRFAPHIRWDNGKESSVDVSGQVESFRLYEPLRNAPELFAQVQLGEYGTDIVWPGNIDMAAETLWRLAQEQSGETMTAEAFRSWRERRAYTLDGAAKALGISRRMVAYYDHGDKPIPRVVALAAKALELSRRESH